MKIYKQYILHVSGMLFILGLYLMETIHWHQSWGFDRYVLPFGFEAEWWQMRDAYYVLLLASYMMIVYLYVRRGRRSS